MFSCRFAGWFYRQVRIEERLGEVASLITIIFITNIIIYIIVIILFINLLSVFQECILAASRYYPHVSSCFIIFVSKFVYEDFCKSIF